MRLGLILLCMSAGQSFVARNMVVVSHPFARNFRKARAFLQGAERRTKSASLRMAETIVAVENTTALLNDDLRGQTEILADSGDFIKPDRDLYEYRCVKLHNNLQVLLVSTAKASSDEEKAAKVEAASVHVKAGHFDDTIPGLAHFHEHMLFLGTEKYPDEDEYEGFLSKYGGFGNAYTDMEDTNYYFSVTTQQSSADQTSEGLTGSLDRLAQFFISPTFEESMVERELRAIDSEYRNGKTSDAWRNYQFLKAVSNQAHPFSNFGCGNYDTLTSKGPPSGELRKFWEKYYRTSNMRLAVVGSSSLDALQKTVEDTFGILPASNDPPRHNKVNPNAVAFPRENANYDIENPAFGVEQLGKIREVVPLLESRSLKVQFATPPLDDPMMKKTKPYRALSHLLGHESPGSLHHMLNELGYLTALTSGAAIDTSDFSLFSLTLGLTPKGMQEKDKVLDLIFQWIALIKKTALEQPDLLTKYHDEIHQISSTNFKFRENGDPTDFCSSAAELLHDDIQPEEILVSGSLSGEYDPVIAQAFLDRLRPDNCMITVTDYGLKEEAESGGWQEEPLYGATYRVSDVTAEQFQRWENPAEIDSRLHVPALNEYIPTDFSLRCDDDGEDMSEADRAESQLEYPKLLSETKNFRMWHKMDRFWRVPKTSIRLSIVTPKTYESPRSMTLNRIYQRVLNDDLNSFVYDASLSGCHYRVACVPTGYKISVRGYSEKLPLLLDTLTTRMLSLIQEMKEGKEAQKGLFDKFEKAKENLLRETKNYRLDAPYQIANYNSRLIMEEDVYYLDNYVDEMEGENAARNPLTMEECARAAEEGLTGRLKANALCIGNIDEKGAQHVTDVVAQHFLNPSRPLHDAESPKFKSMKLPTKEEAISIFGREITTKTIPVKYQELAFSQSEENNAVEVTLQAGCDSTLTYEGIGILDLITNMAYNSAYNQLRTKEQLGYIVSAYTRKTSGGVWGLNIVVQSSSASPKVLEERIEDWLKLFRQELEGKTPESIAMEAQGIVAQLLEQNTKLSQEVDFAWNEIVATETCNERMTTPAFDRLDRLADELVLTTEDSSKTTMSGNLRKTPAELKERVLSFFDKYFVAESPERRVMSSRVYNQSLKEEYEASLTEPGVLSSYSDIRYLKEFLSTWPLAPYWRVVD